MPATAAMASAEVAYSVMDAVPDDEDEVPDDYAPAIVAESSKQLQTMSVANAVMALDMTDEPVLMFRNPGNEQLNIVYRRTDGNIGWIDPPVSKAEKMTGKRARAPLARAFRQTRRKTEWRWQICCSRMRLFRL